MKLVLISIVVSFSVAALKVKLMLRRPYNQLVAQGIVPRKFFPRFPVLHLNTYVTRGAPMLVFFFLRSRASRSIFHVHRLIAFVTSNTTLYLVEHSTTVV